MRFFIEKHFNNENKSTSFIFILTITTSFACECDPPPITEKYLNYKGKLLKSIYVQGRNTSNELDIGSSCAIFIKEGTELIAYGRKDKKGRTTIGMCSGLLYLDGKYSKDEKRELSILKTLKKK